MTSPLRAARRFEMDSSTALTPYSGVRVRDARESEPREPATEPHLVAADPFEACARAPFNGEPRTVYVPYESGLRPGPLSETRLDIAPPVESKPRTHDMGSTLCSPGVVRPAPALVLAPAPVSLVVRSALALSEFALNAAFAVGRLLRF